MTNLHQDIKRAQSEQKARIYHSYKEAGQGGRNAEVITKAEFEEKFPQEQFEIYSLQAVHNFREEIVKAEDVTDKDAAFKEATKDLKPFVVYGNGKKVITFVRKKIAGE